MKLNKPKWRFSIFKYRNNYILWKPVFRHNILLWKDKYNTPRIERNPNYVFCWLFWQFTLEQGSDEEWEQYLWITKYSNNDINLAKETWGWASPEGISTWKDKYYN